MTRRLRIEWSSGRKVTALLGVADPSRLPSILLAHGAGAGQRSPFIDHIRRGLVAARHTTMSFDYPYIEEGRGRPDQSGALIECHRAALARLGEYASDPVLAGKSMGGRIGAHVAAEGAECRGLVFYGYPFIAPGRREMRAIDHLEAIQVPMLFVAGSRDALGPLDVLEQALSRLPRAEAAVIEGGNHSLRVPKSSGQSYQDVLDELVGITVAWIEALGKPGGPK